MLRQLETLASQPLMSLPDGQARHVNDRLAVIACHCPEILAHGQVNRAALLARLLARSDLERGSRRPFRPATGLPTVEVTGGEMITWYAHARA